MLVGEMGCLLGMRTLKTGRHAADRILPRPGQVDWSQGQINPARECGVRNKTKEGVAPSTVHSITSKTNKAGKLVRDQNNRTLEGASEATMEKK